MIKSKRLEKIAEILPIMNTVIDIGADHGYLEELLISTKKVNKVIATDISVQSLQKTQKRAEKLKILDKIELVVADGLLFKSQSKSNFAIIAGIGGRETIAIIDKGKDGSVNEFILVPVQNSVLVREYLIKNKFIFLYDETLFEKGKFYSVIHCKRADKTNWENKYFGKTDIQNMSEDFKKFIDRELKNLKYLDNIKTNKNDNIKYRNMLKELKGE